MRAVLSILAIGVLGACAPEIPDSGLGFDNSPDARRARELALSGGAGAGVPITPPFMISDEVPAGAAQAQVPAPQAVQTAAVDGSESGADIAAETAAALAATSPNPAPPMQVAANPGLPPVPAASPVDPAPVAQNDPGLSHENDFASVSEDRSIQGDAERIARNRQAFEEVAPTAVPARDGNAGPNIVTYALQTSHPRGTQMYKRSSLQMPSRAQRACAKYPSPDQAQIDFLSRGGPDRDRMGLDPDGDGYACAWNPEPFRRANG